MLKFTRNTVLDEFKVNGVNTLRPSPEVVLVYLLSTLDTLKTTIYNYSLLTLTMFFIVYPAYIYLFHVNNGNTRKIGEICAKLTMMTSN